MSDRQTRREFLRASAAAGAGLWLAGRQGFGQQAVAEKKLNIAVIGPSGRGQSNFNKVVGENVIAICDADEKRAQKALERCPDAKFYYDFRELYEKEMDRIDAVVVSTPDHVHAPASMPALKAGKHVYCEKPLAWSVHEVRTMTDTARKNGCVTQMGTQIHAGGNYRRVVEKIQTGAIGAVEEVHVWVGKRWAGGDTPKDTPPVPEGLHWDVWLGPAPYRPYNPAYCPASWRGWWDFGGGTLSDMACHHMDLPHWALNLDHCETVEIVDGPPLHPDSCPPWLIVRWTYKSRGTLPPVTLTWYHGGKRPPHFERGELPEWKGDGTLFVGDKGMLLADYGRNVLLPEDKFADYEAPAPFIPESIGHQEEWLNAIKTGGRTTCNFGYSGPLAETVLLGNVAFRTGKKLEWDWKRMQATNAPEAQKYLRRKYRQGWTL